MAGVGTMPTVSPVASYTQMFALCEQVSVTCDIKVAHKKPRKVSPNVEFSVAFGDTLTGSVNLLGKHFVNRVCRN